MLDADRLTSQQKQEIATKVGLSETAFVSPSSVAEFKLDFFTPVKQIPHCGHATIGTFTYLKKNGMIKDLMTGSGVNQNLFYRREHELKRLRRGRILCLRFKV